MGASAPVAVRAWRARGALGRVAVAEREGAAQVPWFGLPVAAVVAVAQWLGLCVAVAPYLLFALRLRGGRPWATSLGVALGFPVARFVVFEKWFSVPPLKGPLEAVLGLG